MTAFARGSGTGVSAGAAGGGCNGGTASSTLVAGAAAIVLGSTRKLCSSWPANW
jgi:hypothetical protein